VAVREFKTHLGRGLMACCRWKLCWRDRSKTRAHSYGHSEQAARYIRRCAEALVREEGQVRFEYVASGRRRCFATHADPDSRFSSRINLIGWRPLNASIRERHAARVRLQAHADFHQDGLRAADRRRVGARSAWAQTRPRALCQMATGRGKDLRLDVSYRLLRTRSSTALSVPGRPDNPSGRNTRRILVRPARHGAIASQKRTIAQWLRNCHGRLRDKAGEVRVGQMEANSAAARNPG